MRLCPQKPNALLAHYSERQDLLVYFYNANLLIMPGLEAANISKQLLKTIGKGIAIRPILIGSARPANILPQSVSVRGLVNMNAVAVARAQLSPGRKFRTFLENHAIAQSPL